MSKILIAGYGSIGQKHAHNIKALGAELKIWRKRTEWAQAIENDGFILEPSIDEGLAWCDGVIVATSTAEHIPLARKATAAKRAIYIEKPLSHNNEGVVELVDEIEGLVAEVGCQLRQHPNIRALKARLDENVDGKVLAFQAWAGQRLDQWRPGGDYRRSYSADSALGGGALFDLVHEIDLMMHFAGPMGSVYADLRHNSDLEFEAEDLSNLLLIAKGGAAGTIQLDMLSPAHRRGFQIICENAIYKWEMREGKLYRAGTAEDYAVIDEVPPGYHPSQMLSDAAAHFLARIQDPAIKPACALVEGAHDLEILLAARKAAASGQKQEV